MNAPISTKSGAGTAVLVPALQIRTEKKHRVYIIALIDDASRFITGIDVFYNDNFIMVLCQEKVQIKCNQFSLF